MENNYFVITKTIPGSVIFTISPITNTEQKRTIELSEAMPSARLPKDWALGVFLNPALYNMYKKGVFTFDNPDEVTRLAIEEQVYFGAELDFKPRNKEYVSNILEILKSSKRTDILDLLKKDKDIVLTVAKENIDSLTSGVISLLEKETGSQIRLDEE